jgi:hypothetical protein
MALVNGWEWQLALRLEERLGLELQVQEGLALSFRTGYLRVLEDRVRY